MAGNPAGASSPSLAPKGPVLFVDDDHDLRVMVRLVLEERGYLVYAAANGRDAMKMLNTVPPPVLVLSDLRMPLMDGWEFIRRVKSDAMFEGLPIVVQSCEHDRTPPLGISGILKKPIDLAALLALVKKHCG